MSLKGEEICPQKSAGKTKQNKQQQQQQQKPVDGNVLILYLLDFLKSKVQDHYDYRLKQHICHAVQLLCKSNFHIPSVFNIVSSFGLVYIL